MRIFSRHLVLAGLALFLVLPMHTASAQSAVAIADQITIAANAQGIPPALLAAVIENESGFNPLRISRTGCAGLGQICTESAHDSIFQVQCGQRGTPAGPKLCQASTCRPGDGSYRTCTTCANGEGGCVPDQRFNISKNLQGSARVLASKVSSVVSAGCDINTEAGIKTAIYSYNMGAARITPAIRGRAATAERVAVTGVGCSDYEAIWDRARQDFTPKSCSDADDCESGETCQAHDEFSGTICHEDGEPLGIVYSSSPIKLSKLERKSNEPGTYVTSIYQDYLNFGGLTPNQNFYAITVSNDGIYGAPENKPIIISVPSPVVKIPGLVFAAVTPEDLITVTTDGSKIVSIPFLAEYIAAVYRYAIGVFLVLAGIGIIVGGIMYITSGASGDVTQAKKVIGSSIGGVLFMVSSYLILFTINPALTRLKVLDVQYVQGTSVHNESVVDSSEGSIYFRESMRILGNGHPSAITPGGVPYGYNNVPWYFQYDGQWNSITYGATDSCSSIGEGGCMPTAVAMVLKHHVINVNPTHTANIAVETGARICNRGSVLNDDFLDRLASEYNVSYARLSMSDSLPFLQAGYPVFTGGAHIGFTSEGGTKRYDGHYLVFTGVEELGNPHTGQSETFVHVNDPGNRSDKGITHMPLADYLNTSRGHVYVFIPNSQIPTALQQFFSN